MTTPHRTETAGALGYWFIALFGLRTISEGIDFYVGTPLSILLTGLLTAVSMVGFKRLPTKFMAFIWASAALVLCSIMTFALTVEVHPDIQAAQLLKYISYVFVFLFCASYGWNERHLKALLYSFCAVMLLQFVFSLGQVATGTGFNEGMSQFSRAFGLTAHPLPLSYLILCLMVFVFQFRYSLSRLAYRAFMALSFITLYLTLSRTGWIMVALWMLLIWVRHHHPSIKLFLLVVSTPLVISLLYFSGRFDDLVTLPEFIQNHDYERFNWKVTTNSYEWRLVQWYGLVQAGMETPWFGHGLGVTPFFNEFDLKAHNSFIDFFFEGGFFGLVSFTAFLLATVGVLRRSLKRRVEGWRHYQTQRAGGYGLALGYILAMVFASSLFNNPLMMFAFYLNLGFICNVPFRRYLAERSKQQRRILTRPVRRPAPIGRPLAA
jgi:O-antigen ligase